MIFSRCVVIYAFRRLLFQCLKITDKQTAPVSDIRRLEKMRRYLLFGIPNKYKNTNIT
jgi:hypothetical protein